MTRKERNIPITSLEANSIIEGIKWADEHPNLYNMKLWIARNQDNSLHIHNVKPSPIYDDYTKQWTYEGDLSMEIDENLYSEVTFENSPQDVELKLVNNLLLE